VRLRGGLWRRQRTLCGGARCVAGARPSGSLRAVRLGPSRGSGAAGQPAGLRSFAGWATVRRCVRLEQCSPPGAHGHGCARRRRRACRAPRSSGPGQLNAAVGRPPRWRRRRRSPGFRLGGDIFARALRTIQAGGRRIPRRPTRAARSHARAAARRALPAARCGARGAARVPARACNRVSVASVLGCCAGRVRCTRRALGRPLERLWLRRAWSQSRNSAEPSRSPCQGFLLVACDATHDADAQT
jgi:hypothetical protein